MCHSVPVGIGQVNGGGDCQALKKKLCNKRFGELSCLAYFTETIGTVIAVQRCDYFKVTKWVLVGKEAKCPPQIDSSVRSTSFLGTIRWWWCGCCCCSSFSSFSVYCAVEHTDRKFFASKETLLPSRNQRELAFFRSSTSMVAVLNLTANSRK